MKLFYSLVLLLLPLLASGAENEEAKIKQHLSNYLDAFKKRDLEKLSSLWTEDATYINFSLHQSLEGVEEIADDYKKRFEEEKNLQLKLDLQSVTVDGDKAVEKGTAIYSSEGHPEVTAHFVAMLVKEEGVWKLKKVVEVEEEAPLSHYEQLKDLEWLVGKWMYKNEFSEFNAEVEWIENKNFLKQKFVVNHLGIKDLQGEQLIYWDPSVKKVKSWLIDEDGGIGTGAWSKEGSNWYVSLVFTLPDGGKGSATHVYSKQEDGSYTFSADDREVDGAMLPDIEPIKLTKIVTQSREGK